MNNPPENYSLPETNPTPAENKPASASSSANCAQLLIQFEAENLRRKNNTRFGLVSMFGGVPLIFLCAVCFASSFSLPFSLFAFIGCVLVGAIILSSSLKQLLETRSTDILRLAKVCGPQAIGPLIERLNVHPTTEESELIWLAVSRLLKRLSPDEADALTGDVRECLYRRLVLVMQGGGCTEEVVELCVAWMKILEQIGDAREVRIVKNLATTPAHHPLFETLRNAAQECLPHIEARIAAQEPGKTLLRASVAPPVAPETLLRPAAKANANAPNQLLRPAEGQDAERNSGE